jgi:cob(I)alamin adenosyltransferase
MSETQPSEIRPSETVEEANAAIGAAISASSLPTEIESVLFEIQHELLDLAETIDSGQSAPEPDRLRRAWERFRVDGIPRGYAVFGGTSDAAGLLKLARTITRRARRETASTTGATYLDLLCDLLLAIAFQVEERELAQFSSGWCGAPEITNVVRPTRRSY